MLAVAALHDAGIVHHDVKPDNLMADAALGEGCIVKLCDFGLAGRVCELGRCSAQSTCGTLPFMAPEMLYVSKHCAKVDVWSMGVLAYVLLYGFWPHGPRAKTALAMKAAGRGSDHGVRRHRRRQSMSSPHVSVCVRVITAAVLVQATLAREGVALLRSFLARPGCDDGTASRLRSRKRARGHRRLQARWHKTSRRWP